MSELSPEAQEAFVAAAVAVERLADFEGEAHASVFRAADAFGDLVADLVDEGKLAEARKGAGLNENESSYNVIQFPRRKRTDGRLTKAASR